jgi:hypothetical protein
MTFSRLNKIGLILTILAGLSSAFVSPRSGATVTQHASIVQVLQQRHNLISANPTKTSLNGVMEIVGVSPEPIHTAFAFATFGPQPFWLLMILLPKNDITKKVMGSLGKRMLVGIICCTS